MKRIYLDYASTTPLDPEVLKAMMSYLKTEFGNPSALYKEGIETKKAIQGAREKIARLINVRTDEIVFTASGTEADNLAILGIFNAYRKKFTPHIITTNIEHPGILEVCKFIETEGGEVTYIPVEENGIVDPKKIKAALKPTTVLVSVMYANNEIGTIQSIREIYRVIQEFKKSREDENNAPSGVGRGLAAKGIDSHLLPYFHTDASQAGNYLDLSFQKLGVDMMTLDASKIYGPKGIGLLVAKRYIDLKPIIFGGGQEKGIRSGTENTAGIVGFAEALTRAQEMKEKESARVLALREYFFDSVIKKYPSVFINGDREKRLPNNVNICLPGVEAEFAVIKLDHEGISCSSASSCLNLSENSYSYVVDALGERGRRCRESSLRFTLGRNTAKKDIDLTLRKLNDIIIRQ